MRGTGQWLTAFLGVMALLFAPPRVFGQENSQAQPSASKEVAIKDQPGNTTEQWPVYAVDKQANIPSEADQDNEWLGMRFVKDQEKIWTSPAGLRLPDLQWLLPAGAFTGFLLATDSDAVKHMSRNPATVTRYKNLSNAGVAALVGAGAGLWAASHFTHNSHWRETGFLAGEAALNSFVVTEGMKYSFARQRPFQGDGTGAFFSGGTSFPSEHATVAWSVAGILAHEYPGPLTKLMVYGLASAVSFSRVRAGQHFPSDTFVGAVVGDLVARHIFREHHDPDLGGAAWESPDDIVRDPNDSSSKNPGSPYVPLDSWVYPAIDRLIAQGFINTAFLGSRPWTRIECALLLQEASEQLGDNQDKSSEPNRLYEQLSAEFAPDFKALEQGSESSVQLESLYTRSTEIVGRPLNDSYHFGQTIVNNFGRPYQQGFNTADGFSGWAAEGRFSIYVRGEYRHAPTSPGFLQSVQNLISTLDANPIQGAAPIASTNQFQLLDTYVSSSLQGWNLAFGKQSLWWGQGEGGALLFSDNAEPIYMFRANRIVPISLPWIFHKLGPVSIDAFMGKLSGNKFPPRPVLHGEKISVKPTQNLELAFTRMAEMGGVGRAITSAAIWNSYTSFHESNFFGSNENPGKRTAGFEFSYRLPLLRNWLTVYTDSLSPDDVSSVSAPRRAAINPGIYLTHFPKISKLDLRIEGVNTDTPSSSLGGHFVYYDHFYRDLSTNKGNIIGSWIGREGQGIQAWSNYWFDARNSLQFGFRHAKVAPDFIPQGETLNDGFLNANWWVRNNIEVSAGVQYEKWLAPVLNPTQQQNWTSTIEIVFQPRAFGRAFHSSSKIQDQGVGQVEKDSNP